MDEHPKKFGPNISGFTPQNFFSGSCRGNIFITNKYTTEVFSKVFQNIGQVMTKQ